MVSDHRERKDQKSAQKDDRRYGGPQRVRTNTKSVSTSAPRVTRLYRTIALWLCLRALTARKWFAFRHQHKNMRAKYGERESGVKMSRILSHIGSDRGVELVSCVLSDREVVQ